MDLKVALGIIATIIAFVSYVPYFRDIIRGQTKPHAFSWLIWGLLTGIAFIGQLIDNAGPGSWVTGFTTIVCLFIFIFALQRGEKHITKSDQISLAGAIMAIGLWLVTSDPLLAIILITVIDALGFYPTFRKSFYKPDQETAITYTLSAVKFAIAILALETYTIITWLYPASLVVMNAGFVVMLLVRRRRLGLAL